MSGDAGLEFSWHSPRKGSQGYLLVAQAGGSFSDKLDIGKEEERLAVAHKLVEKFPGMELDEAIAQLERLAQENLDNDAHHEPNESQADLLIALVETEEVRLVHTPNRSHMRGYAVITIGDHVETWRIDSEGFRMWLLAKFYRSFKKAPNGQALDTAINTIEAKAQFDGEPQEVLLRVALHEGAIWIDLCDDQWRAVRIDKDGYSVVESKDLEVRFARTNGMEALPPPEEGGSIEDLRSLVNVQSDSDWIRFKGWLVTAIHPTIDHPILLVNGKEGSAKTTTCAFVRRLIDPNEALLRRPPREELDVILAAQNSWTVAFDNFSRLSQRLSDTLCCLATGSSFSKRKLYTNGDESLFNAKRPVIVNGIPDLATYGDFVSRLIHLTLQPIAPHMRRNKADVERDFAEAQPRILGALYRAVSCALRRVDEVTLPNLPRMADACTWVTAAEPELGLNDGDFIESLESQAQDSVDAVIDGSAVGPALMEFLEAQHGVFVGTAAELLAGLEQQLDGRRRPAEWPNSPQSMANKIRRLAGSLEQKGIEVREPAKGANPRNYTITRKPDQGSSRGEPRAAAAETPSPGAKMGDSRGSAPSALRSQTPEEGGAPPEQKEMGPDLDGHWEGH